LSEGGSAEGPDWLGAPAGVPVLYYEDLEEGREQWGGEIVVDREEMLDYARRHDPWPFHVDEALARRSVFGDLVASGGYTIGLWFRLGHMLLNDFGEVWAVMGGIDWKLKFVRGVKAGDRLKFMRRLKGKRESSKPGRGVLFIDSALIDQATGDPVLTLEEVVLAARRPDAES